MIARTSFAISMEESRFTLNGALLLLQPDGLTMVATDGHRLAYRGERRSDSGQVEQPFRALVPKKAMAEIAEAGRTMPARTASAIFAGDDNHLFFQIGTGC